MRGLRRTFSVNGLTNPRPGVRVEIESFQEKRGVRGSGGTTSGVGLPPQFVMGAQLELSKPPG